MTPSTALVSDEVVRTEISGSAEEYAAPFEDEDQVAGYVPGVNPVTAMVP